ncbi:hypothetical protein ACQYWY_21945 [Comamonas sediminis]|uniref:hypothetical protein n=2 Tax=Comamonadaceae TaxID=80864 RepID=UPI001EFAF08C|nr:hypothetical protein [Comamonas sp. B21-038]ULR87170.1 hypothetical protein MJ205_11835 [Comamonas sp. B21-038]
MQSTDISMPIAKATSAVTLATAAQADVADKIAQAATVNSSFETWFWVNSIPWGTIASIVAALYTVLLICEWFWKKLWRPAFERWGWVKPRLGPRIITLDEYRQMSETQRADLS